jgi:two-component system nitrate/nitrite response regulator NarP
MRSGEISSERPNVPVWNRPTPARVVIADKHPLVLEGLANLLRALHVEDVERCCGGAELLSMLLERQPDLAIADVRLGEPDCLAVLREFRALGKQVPVILLTGTLRDAEVLEGVELGIRGLVAKDAPLDVLANCVRTVLEGGTCLDQGIVGRAMAALLMRETALRELALVLTAREMQVLHMVVAGQRARDAAARLSVSEGTLKVHLHHIYQKLNVTSREGLVALARDKGIV